MEEGEHEVGGLVPLDLELPSSADGRWPGDRQWVVAEGLCRLLVWAQLQGMNELADIRPEAETRPSPSLGEVLRFTGFGSFADAFAECLSLMPEKHRVVVQHRLLSLKPTSGLEVGRMIGVSRQRVSQLEPDCAARLDAFVDGEPVFQVYREVMDRVLPRAMHADEFLQFGVLLADGQGDPQQAAALAARLLNLRKLDEWYVSDTELDRWSALRDHLREAMGEDPSCSNEQAEQVTKGLFTGHHAMEKRLSELGFGFFLGEWLASKSGREKVVFALLKSDSPMSPEEAAATCGISASYALNVLRDDPRVARASNSQDLWIGASRDLLLTS